MGWYWQHKPKRQKLEAFFRELYDWEHEDGHANKILDFAVLNLSVVYMACEARRPGKAPYVYAGVCKIGWANEHYNFGYKPMDEGMGPCETECPERIMKLLTPYHTARTYYMPPKPGEDGFDTWTPEYNREVNGWARTWRKHCWDNIKRRKAKPKLSHGCVIKFKTPITFSGGGERDTFLVQFPKDWRTGKIRGGSPSFWDTGKYTRYRIGGIWKDLPFEIVKEAA